MGWFNVGSFVLGLIAWALPIVSMTNYVLTKERTKNWAIYSMLSAMACIISLYFQIIYDSYMVKIEDWAALIDTSKSLMYVTLVLVVVTIGLNIGNWILNDKRRDS